MVLRIACRNGETYEVGAQLFGAYSRVHANAEHEFARMTIWLETHKAKRPATAASAPRFVANWFSRVPKLPVISVKATQQTATIHALTGGGRGITIEG